MALLAQSEKPDSLHQDYGFDMGNHLFTQIVYCFILNIYAIESGKGTEAVEFLAFGDTFQEKSLRSYFV